MWEYDLYRRRPFYRRTWFKALSIFILLSALILGGFALWAGHHYEERAAQFDLTKLSQMEAASTIYDRNGKLIGKLFIQNREPIPASQIPKAMMNALVSAEDARFYEDNGVDFYGMARAALTNWRSGRIRQGASTITQQLARNTYGLFQRTYDRKILEIFLALRVARHYSKKEILRMYLNRVYFGNGFYGVQAASLGYFGKPASKLDISESATLAGLLKSPNNLSPWSNRQACIAERDHVIKRMLELNYIDQKTYDQATHEELIVKNRLRIHANSYALDYVRQQAIALLGHDSVISDGYRIYTTLDSDLQQTSEKSMERNLRNVESRPDYKQQTVSQYDNLLRKRGDDAKGNPPRPAYLQGAFVAIDNATGEILALAGGRDFKQSQFNRAFSLRPAGTAFLPFVYAAGFDKGLFPGMLVQDTAMNNRQVMIGGTTGILGEWGAESASNRFEGPIPATYALVKSKNAATVRFGMNIGVNPVISLAEKAGMTRENKKGKVTNLRPYPSTFLGSGEVSLMDMTLAYTMFPNGGVMPKKPVIIRKVENAKGEVVYAAKEETKRIISATTAYEVHQCLANVLEWGTGSQAFTEDGLRRFPVAGKTGTAYDFTNDWFIGYDSAITCGVWAGFDKPQSIYRGAFSNKVVLPIWVDIMNASFSRFTPKPIEQPPGLKRYDICRDSGLLATSKCFDTRLDKATGQEMKINTTYTQLATPEQAPKAYCNIHGAGMSTAGTHAYLTPQKREKSKWPRAVLAVNTANVKPVDLKSSAVIGANDPYHATHPTTTNAKGNPDSKSGKLANGKPTPGSKTAAPPQVQRAQPAGVLDQTQGSSNSTIKIAPPPALKF